MMKPKKVRDTPIGLTIQHSTDFQVNHKSIWLFETVDVKSEQNSPTPAPPAGISSPDPYVPNGSYYLRNVGTGQYMSVVTSPYWRYCPGTKTYKVSAICSEPIMASFQYHAVYRPLHRKWW
jgi:hypothetical protein